ncbi:MAG: beta-lactamase family protein [Bacteroidales bacterium]|nr:beta-lactamase family protein [Bacteroidales bacterium]
MDAVVDSFMRFWALKGVSIAVTRHDSLLYARGYGKADPSTPMTPGTIMRLASVSKLLTAIGVMRLQEEGKLYLDTPVFGPYGILNEYDGSIRDDNYYLMTVEHLLRHQGGFHYRGADVMFTGYHPDPEEFVRQELRRPLAFTPGTWQQYSNFGYFLLSLVIEKASGMPYEEFMQKEVFEPCGCRGFRIAGNYLKDRLPGESMYFMQPDSEPVTSFDGKYAGVEKCYGGNDVTSLLGAGAWVGSAVELARVVSCINGLEGIEDILSADSIQKMTTWYDENTFSLGWVDTKDGEWTRTGSFSGTSAIVKVFPDGESWVLISNTSAWRGSKFSRNTSYLVKNLRRRFSASLPQRDLFSE